MIKDKISVTIDREVLDKIENIRKKVDMSRSEAINELLRDRLKMQSRFSEGILRKRKGDLLKPYKEEE